MIPSVSEYDEPTADEGVGEPVRDSIIKGGLERAERGRGRKNGDLGATEECRDGHSDGLKSVNPQSLVTSHQNE